MRVLISGAGIAGPTLAYWLARHGMTPTLVEKAPVLRTGGYVIDFWGAGFEVANRMGLLPDLLQAGYAVREVRVVDRNGRKVSGFPAAAFARAVGSGFTSLPRGDLAAAIFGALGNTTETIFGDTIARVDQTEDEVDVAFDDVVHEPSISWSARTVCIPVSASWCSDPRTSSSAISGSRSRRSRSKAMARETSSST